MAFLQCYSRLMNIHFIMNAMKKLLINMFICLLGLHAFSQEKPNILVIWGG